MRTFGLTFKARSKRIRWGTERFGTQLSAPKGVRASRESILEKGVCEKDLREKEKHSPAKHECNSYLSTTELSDQLYL